MFFTAFILYLEKYIHSAFLTSNDQTINLQTWATKWDPMFKKLAFTR